MSALTWDDVSMALARRYGRPTRLRNRRDPLEELLFIVLSARTEEYNYVRTYRRLRRRYRSWTALRRAGVEEIAATIRVGGLALVKARQISSILEQLEDDGHPDLRFLERLPNDEALRYLTSLPGVGPKTARCVLLFALDRPVFPVDTHVWRVAGRLGMADPTGRQPTGTQQVRLEASVPEPLRLALHVQLLRHGRDTCRSKAPLCDGCPLIERCSLRAEGPHGDRNNEIRLDLGDAEAPYLRLPTQVS
jgi:endonuclease III